MTLVRTKGLGLDTTAIRQNLAAVVERMGATGYGVSPEVFMTPDGRWHTKSGASADPADYNTVSNDLSVVFARIDTGMEMHAQTIVGIDNGLVARIRGLDDAGDHMLELNFKQYGAGITEQQASEFNAAILNGEVYAGGPLLDADLVFALNRAAQDGREQSLINDVMWPQIREMAAQAEDLGIDWDSKSEVQAFFREYLSHPDNAHLLESDGTFTGGMFGNLVLNMSSPEFAASNLWMEQQRAAHKAGILTDVQFRKRHCFNPVDIGGRPVIGSLPAGGCPCPFQAMPAAIRCTKLGRPPRSSAPAPAGPGA